MNDKTYLQLRKAFDEFDTDHDNIITTQELRQCLHKYKIASTEITEEQLNILISQVDVNQNNLIEWSEFYEYMRPIVDKKESLETIRNSFKAFDLDGDGYVDAKELKAKLSELQGQDIPMDEIYSIIASVDSNGDGKIDLEEFIALMRDG